MADAGFGVQPLCGCQPVWQRDFFCCLRSQGAFLCREYGDFVLRQVFHDHLFQLGAVDGLGEIVLEASFQVLFPCPSDGVGCQGDDGSLLVQVARQLNHGFQGFDAVHVGHHVVKEDEIVFFLLHQSQAFQPALGRINLYLGLLQKAFDHGEIHHRVIHHQDLALRGAEGHLVILAAGEGLVACFFEIPQGSGIHHLLDNLEAEGGTLAVDAFYLQLAAHQG